MSDNSLFGVVVSTLAVFNVTPPVDDHGNLIQLKAEVTNGIVS